MKLSIAGLKFEFIYIVYQNNIFFRAYDKITTKKLIRKLKPIIIYYRRISRIRYFIRSNLTSSNGRRVTMKIRCTRWTAHFPCRWGT